MSQKTKILITLGVAVIAIGILLILQSFSFGKLRIIFCDVGQGDGMLIISPAGHQAVVDAGAGAKMVDCLSHYMPFWDRSIELIVPTHAHQEHMEGFVEILARYRVKSIVGPAAANNEALFYKVWESAIKAEGASVYAPDVGETILLDPQQNDGSARLEILWPPREQINQWKKKPPADLNDTSIVMRLVYGGFCAYLTGDLPKETLEGLIKTKCQVLKVVHHGSKTGTSQKLLAEINPQVAVIQVGKNNKFGHPHKEVLDLLAASKTKVLRNDMNGVVEVDVANSGFTIKTER